MNVQTSKRIMCCLLAVLFLGFCFTRPLAITANATGAETAAMAGFVGIAPEVAIPIIIALLGVSVVAANWEDICDWVDGAYDSITTWINDEEVVPAYKYNDQLYVTEGIVYSVASTVNSYFGLKYDDAWELGKQFSKMYTVEFSTSSSQNEFIVFADSAPYTQTVSGEQQLVLRKPCVVYSKAYGTTEIYDYSGETGSASWSFLGTTITGLDVSLTDNITAPVVDLGATVTVTTPENEKEKAIPIAPSDTTPYEDAKTEVKVETDTGTETVPGTSTVDLSGVLSWLKSIWQAITGLASKIVEPIAEAITAVKTAVNTGITTITDTITETINAIIEWLISMGATLADILEWIKTLPASIAQAISGVLTDIFVPSTDYVTTKVEALRARFNWIDPILGYGEIIKAELTSTEPPVLYLHLQNAEGSYNYGGTVKFLDLSWYARYKSQGDAIISGFLWALFAWRMYIKLPGIINGAAGDIGQMSYGESMWQRAENRKEHKERGSKKK